MVSAGTTTATATGLTANTSYTFKAYSDTSCNTELATAGAILTKPAKPTVTAGAGSGKLTISSSLTGGSGVLTKWQYTTNNGTNWSDIDDTDNTLSTVVSTRSDSTSLSNGTTYSFKVRAVNDTGEGPSSEASASASPVAEVLEASNVNDTRATLTIKNYIGKWHYKQIVPDTGVYTPCSFDVAAGTTTAILSSLTQNTSYTFKAYSDKINGQCTTELATVNFTTKIPTLEASEVTMTTAKLTVKYFSNPFPYYYRQLQPSVGGCKSMVTSRTAALAGLTPGTSYTYAFYGSVAGCGSDDDEQTIKATRAKFTTQAPPAPDPDPVLSSSSITATTATLTIADSDGGSWYYKHTTPADGDHPYGTCSTEVTGTSVELTGLSASTSYSFTAYSDSGCTSAIATSTSFTTLALPRAVSLSTESLSVTEGSTASYTVVLNSETTGTVTINLSGNDTTVATLSPASLSFTTSNWEEPRSVTVSGTNDADTQNETTTISHSASGGDYEGLTNPPLTVTVEDPGAQVVQKRINQVA